MNKYIIIIIFVLLIIYFINNYTNENFDAKIKDKITKEQCGTVCTETVGCSAIAYDHTTQACYLAKDQILNNEPERGIYIDEFNTDQLICNKLVPIPEFTDDVLTENKRLNMFYSCLNTENKCSANYDTYKIVNDKMTKIDSKEIDNIPYEDYNVRDIIWPINKRDLIYNKTYPEKNFIFEKTNKQYDGEYLYPYKCSAGIPEDKCSEACYSDEKCNGYEFNPVYLVPNADGSQDMYNNVHCPMKKRGNEIIRKDEARFGHYYNKK